MPDPAMVDQDAVLQDTGGAPLANTIDGVLFDLDGVVYLGDEAVTHAPEAIEALAVPYAFVTNNAGRTPEAIAEHLSRLGIAAHEDQVMTSALAASRLVTEHFGKGARVYVVGGPGLRRALGEQGLTVVQSAEEHPDVVVQGSSPTITWHDLAEASYAIHGGASYVATNLDSTMPTERGMALGNGAFVQAVVHATGVSPLFSGGKPAPEIFQHAAQRGNMANPIVVGDRLDTDIAGGNAAGMPGLVVLTGVVGAREILTAPAGRRPAYIARDLRDLHQAHQAPRAEGGVWVCGLASATIRGDELTVATEGSLTTLTGKGESVAISLDELRAASAASWSTGSSLNFFRDIHIRA